MKKIEIEILLPDGSCTSVVVQSVPHIGETCYILGVKYRVSDVLHTLADYGMGVGSEITLVLQLP
jgi:hypothetical protein